MSMNPKELVKGKKYVIMITNCIRPAIGECIGHDEILRWGMLKVLNKGFMQDAILKREDYIPMEEYDEAKHGPIET